LLQDFAQEKAPIVYYAFDLLRLNGKNLQALPVEERKTQLEELLKKPPGVIRYSVSFTKDIEELLGRTRELGLEGLFGNASPVAWLGQGCAVQLDLEPKALFSITRYP
jgi:ATP-dependent DNA ligase